MLPMVTGMWAPVGRKETPWISDPWWVPLPLPGFGLQFMATKQ